MQNFFLTVAHAVLSIIPGYVTDTKDGFDSHSTPVGVSKGSFSALFETQTRWKSKDSILFICSLLHGALRSRLCPPMPEHPLPTRPKLLRAPPFPIPTLSTSLHIYFHLFLLRPNHALLNFWSDSEIWRIVICRMSIPTVCWKEHSPDSYFRRWFIYTWMIIMLFQILIKWSRPHLTGTLLKVSEVIFVRVQ